MGETWGRYRGDIGSGRVDLHGAAVDVGVDTVEPYLVRGRVRVGG
jgi:hypothetical protein